MQNIETLTALIGAIGGPKKFGSLMWPNSRHPHQRTGDARFRGALPVALWPKAVEIAKAHDLALDIETLHRWHANARRRQWRRLNSIPRRKYERA